jgi:hypothetical protein
MLASSIRQEADMVPAGAIEVGQNCQSGVSDDANAAKSSGVWRILAANGRAEFRGHAPLDVENRERRAGDGHYAACWV